jgi:hypothetical protein
MIRLANLTDLPYVIHLSKLESRSIGFIPKMAYKSAITGIKTGKRWSNVCNDKLAVIGENGDLVGFCLVSFGRKSKINVRIGKIAQICLQEDARLIQRGANLLNYVMQLGIPLGVYNWQCGCADDLLSNFFWSSMGWSKVGDRKGISHTNTWKPTSDRLINIYRSPVQQVFEQ